MASQSPDYKQLYIEEQRRREEEQRRREAAEEAQKQEQRRREEAEVKTRQTTLPEFLDACHNHLHAGLTVQTDLTLSTQGDPANANNKLRPERLCVWDDFPASQEAIWKDIMESAFAMERHFTSVNTLRESGVEIRERMMSSELDLHFFQRWTVENPVSRIVDKMYNDQALKRKLNLCGSVKFENHANMLSPEQRVEEGMHNLSISGGRRQQSPRLQAKAKAPSSSEPSAGVRSSTSLRFRPRADQFCVYTTSEESRVVAFVMEYKAPHKVPLGYIYEGLDDMDLDDVVESREGESPRDRFRRLMAAIVTQAFSYMVQIGVEYGCVCTGEANIFLRVPQDPTTVYYFLSVPKGDVGDTSGWTPDADSPNRLHLTAVGQMLAFTLQALKTPPRSQKWREDALARLKRWEVLYDVLLEDIPLDEAPSSEYRPPRDTGFLRMSPVQLRQRRARMDSPDCSQPQDQHSASDEDPDPDTPSRQLPRLPQSSRTRPAASGSLSGRHSRHAGQGGQYCTQNCLLGLVKGGPLDLLCPNARNHGTGHHRIDLTTFLKRIRQQLSKDLDQNCEPIGRHGACGVPFRVRLDSHGYTMVAKACPIDFVHRLRWEANVYNLLRSIQGTHVPVLLGNIDLEVPYYCEVAQLVHMMFLSYGGKRMDKQLASADKSFALQQVQKSIQAIRALGIRQNDLAPRNMLWDDETRQAMVIDFERAETEKVRAALGAVSGNARGSTLLERAIKHVGGEGADHTETASRDIIKLET